MDSNDEDEGMRRAITLVEVLIVVAILVLVGALLFPVLVRSRAAAKTAACTSNLRQIYISMELYAEAYDGRYPLRIDPVLQSAGARSVADCPSDNHVPGANAGLSKVLGFKASYFYPDPIQDFWDRLREEDSNHGVLACVLHGQTYMTATPSEPLMDTSGLVLRLRRDGSVTRVQVGHVCASAERQGMIMTRSTWTLFTDAWPCPEPYCPAGSYRCP